MIFTRLRRLQCKLPMKILVCLMIVSLLAPYAQGSLIGEMKTAYAGEETSFSGEYNAETGDSNGASVVAATVNIDEGVSENGNGASAGVVPEDEDQTSVDSGVVPEDAAVTAGDEVPRAVDTPANCVDVIVTANSLSALYDGYTKTVGGIKSVTWADGNPGGAVLSGLNVPEVARTAPGKSPVAFDGTGVITINGTDVTENYNIIVVEGALNVNPRDSRIRVTVTANSLTAAYNGYDKTIGGIKSVVWTDGNPGGAVLGGLSVPEVTRALPGDTPVKFTGVAIISINGIDVTPNYEVIIVDGLLSVKQLIDNRIKITVKANSARHVFDGTEKSVSGYTATWADGNPGGSILSGLRAEAFRTELGETRVDVTGTAVVMLNGFNVAAAYNIIREPGTLAVVEDSVPEPIDVVITANSGEFKYDGAEKSVGGYTISWSDGNPDGAVLIGVGADTRRKVPGSTSVPIVGKPVISLNGIDVTGNYNIITVDGLLKVNQLYGDDLIKVTATANSLTAMFDGMYKRVEGYTVEWSDGNNYGAELLGLEVPGVTSRDIGITPVVFVNKGCVITLDGVDVTANYNISLVEGRLNIIGGDPLRLIIAAVSGEFCYDGTGKCVSGYNTIWVDGYLDGAELSGVDVLPVYRSVPGITPVEITGTPIITLDGIDITDRFYIEKVPGYLLISNLNGEDRIKVTATANSLWAKFDGEPKFVSGYTEVWSDGNPGGAVLTGLEVPEVYGVLPVEKPVVFKGEGKVFLGAEDVTENYEIITVDGYLTIKEEIIGDPPFPVYVVANSAEYDYDGTAKSVGGYKVLWADGKNVSEISPEGFAVSGFNVPTVYRTEQGTTPVLFDEIGIITYYGEEYTGYLYMLFVLDGTLTINPPAGEPVTVVVTANSAEFKYDGTEKSVGGYAVSWSDGNKAGAVLSGLSVPEVTRRVPGYSEVVFEGTPVITIDGVDVTENYNIIIDESYLHIGALFGDERILVTATVASGAFDYDGTAKSIGSYYERWADGNPGGAKLSGLSVPVVTRTEPGTSNVRFEGIGRITLDGLNVTANYRIVTINGALTINKPVDRETVTVTANSAEYFFDGQVRSVGGYTVHWSQGNPAGAELSGINVPEVFGSVPRVYPVVIEGSAVITKDGLDVTGNYNIILIDGTLIIYIDGHHVRVRVKANSGEFNYDGLEKTVNGYTAIWEDGNPYGAELSGISAEASRKTEGTTPVYITGTPSVTYKGEDVTYNYSIYFEPGELRINSLTGDDRITVTVRANSLDIRYDGDWKSVGGYEVEWSDGNPGGADLSGLSVPEVFRLFPGVTPVVFEGTGCITLDEMDVTSNYNIILIPGELAIYEITTEPIRVYVTPNSAEYTYDGTEKSVDGILSVEWDYLTEGVELSGLYVPAVYRTDPGVSPVVVMGTGVVTLNGDDITKDYHFEFYDGELKINRGEITITAASDKKYYDGLPLTNNNYKVEGAPDGFTVTAVVQGTRLLPGTSPNMIESYKIYDNNGSLIEDPEKYFSVECVNGILFIDAFLT